MNVVRCLLLAALLMGTAERSLAQCLRDEVEAHVRQQLAIYGPQSARHEYFGFIYLHQGMLGSAVARSRECTSGKCVVDSNDAVQWIPKAAKVLGEWHTHPHRGSASLSSDDVRGAYNNRHIRCYFAFYSTSSGEIHRWDPHLSSVPRAMASRVRIGHYVPPPFALPERRFASN